MGLFAIADLHLSLGKNKPMCIFKGWENHAERLKENWNKLVGEDDTVVIAGDISWATELTDAVPDLLFIDEELKGKKIILKGNHDYWWTSLSKLKALNLKNIDFLHNNAFLIGDIAVCGTRGWLNEEDKIHCEKLQKREALRLEASIKQAKALNASEIYAFLHYSPAYGDFVNFHITDVLQINVSNYESGIYFVKMYSETNRVGVQRLVVVK